MAQSNDEVKTNGNPQEENNNNNNNGSNEATATTGSSASALHSQTGSTTVGLSPGLYGGYGSSYGLGAGTMYGSGGYAGYGGYGGYGGGMMVGDPGSMMFGGGSGLGHPGITNILFNFQSLVFSLGQTIQIVSMNSQALKHMFVSSKQMIQQSIMTFGDMRQQFETFVLDYDLSSMLQAEDPPPYETKEELIKKRKLKAIRWTMAFALSVLGYKIAKYILKRIFQNRQRAITGEYPHNSAPSQYYNAGGGDLYHQHQGYYNNPSSSQQYYGYGQSRW